MAKLGSLVQVLATPHVQLRSPSVIGQRGTVHVTPEYPSSLFTVQLNSGISIKLQSTAMKIVRDSTTASFALVEKTVLISKNNLADIVLSPVHRETHSSQINHHSSFAAASSLTAGSLVTIIATENVQQRAPQRVGELGIIKEVPVHPITWFKVEFCDGKVLAFRPSALLPVGESQGDTSVSSLQAPPTNRVVASEPEQESILHQTVKICKGRLVGETGRVIKSGNGWVQLLTREGEIAKRMHEVKIIRSNEHADIRSQSSFGDKNIDLETAKCPASSNISPATDADKSVDLCDSCGMMKSSSSLNCCLNQLCEMSPFYREVPDRKTDDSAASLMMCFRTESNFNNDNLRERSDSSATDIETQSPELQSYDFSTDKIPGANGNHSASSKSIKRVIDDALDQEWLLPPRKDSNSIDCSPYIMSTCVKRSQGYPTILSQLQTKKLRVDE